MYGGEIIYQVTDEFGRIDVIDYQNSIRGMHFGNSTQQSAMLLNNPYLLIHKYTQAMLLPTCWLEPKNVLVLGLGSGSIVKHLYNYFQQSNIDAVELREEVIKIAYDYFLLPEQNERLKIYNVSAYDWLDSYNSTKKYDLIIVDMYLTTKAGNDLTISVSSYIDIIKYMLDINGISIFNNISGNAYSYPSYIKLSKVFEHNLFTVNVDAANSILFGSRGHVPGNISLDTLRNLEATYLIPYTYYFNKLYRI